MRTCGPPALGATAIRGHALLNFLLRLVHRRKKSSYYFVFAFSFPASCGGGFWIISADDICWFFDCRYPDSGIQKSAIARLALLHQKKLSIAVISPPTFALAQTIRALTFPIRDLHRLRHP
jgi:hypothetical protein